MKKNPKAKRYTQVSYLEALQKQLKELRAQQELHSAADLEAIGEQLARASALRDKDLAAARQIWQGIIQLYGDKAWAAEPVAAARTALQETATDARSPTGATAESGK